MIYHTERSKPTDSLAWSKKFEVLSISRLDLRSYGLTIEQINSLSDADMERIAEEIQNMYNMINDFEDDVLLIARLVLAEKGKETIND